MLRTEPEDRCRREAFAHRPDVEFAVQPHRLAGQRRVGFLEQNGIAASNEHDTGKSAVSLRAHDGIHPSWRLRGGGYRPHRQHRDQYTESADHSFGTLSINTRARFQLTRLPLGNECDRRQNRRGDDRFDIDCPRLAANLLQLHRVGDRLRALVHVAQTARR